MSATFKLLHISDLHFAIGPNRLPSPIQSGGLKGAFEAIASGHRGNWFQPASHSTRAARALARYVQTTLIKEDTIDLLLITGDLAATGDVADLELSKEYLFGAASAGVSWSTVDDEPRLAIEVDKVLLPGNHDRYVGSSLRPGSLNFETVFSASWRPFQTCNRISGPYLIRNSEEALAILSADFSFRRMRDSVSSPIGFIGRGHVYQDVIDCLLSATHELRTEREPVAVAWAVHFPPSFPDGDPNLVLENQLVLENAARASGVRLIFAGHTHQDLVYSCNSITVNCAGSATQADSHSRWHFAVCEVDVSQGQISGGRVVPFHYQKGGRNNFVRGSAQAF